jgi:hypothetical protein
MGSIANCVWKPFTRGNLYQLLSNPLYVGLIPHKGETYPGLHEGIVPTRIWERAAANRPELLGCRLGARRLFQHAVCLCDGPEPGRRSLDDPVR